VSAVTVVPAYAGVPGGESAVGPLDNRFHVVSVACLRVIQIRNGARPRLDPGGHKPCVAAVAEVIAGTVPYYLS
jgi:DNA-directed RNA polymerase subunit K/omega